MFTVVIPFWNGHQYLERLLPSIPESIPVILVDDLSDKPIPMGSQNTQIIRLTEKGYFTGAVNKGIEACDTDVLILNQDTYFTDDSWLNFIEENKSQYGLFGERAGSHPAWPNRYIHGTFMYIRRDVIDTIGLMDADNYPLWGSTAEYQLRACRKGFKANPARQVPGFVHKRRGPHGTAIQQLLGEQPGKRGKFILSPPAISVIITCYNYGRYLQDAVNSLIGGKTSLGQMPGQSFQAFEIIIVDDGSTDNSAEIAESLADPWQGIHLVRQENKGSASAMNTGIQASHARKGGLIAPLDGDDMMEQYRLERMLEAYGENPHSVIYDNIQYFGNSQRGIITDWQTMKKMDKLNLKGYNFERMLDRNAGFGMHKGLLYPKQAWEEAGGYPEIMTQGREDWAFNVGLGIKGWCGVNTGEYDYLYRRELQNRTVRNTTPKYHAFFLGQIKSLFPSIYAGERPEMCCGRPTAGSNGKVASMATRHSRDLPGQKGMVILEYIGNNAGDVTWYGDKTRTSYLLGGARKRGYVDKRDAASLLAMRKRGKSVFIQIEAVEERQTETTTTPELLGESAAMLVKKSIPEVRKILPGLSLPVLEAVLKAEKANKNRSTAIAAIEAELEVKSVQLV